MEYLRIKVVPRAKVTEWVEPLADGTLKVRVAAVPEKGKANEVLLKFLAKHYNVSPRSVTILSGKNDVIKLIKIAD